MSVNIIEFTPAHAQAVADMWNDSWDGWGGSLTVRTAQDILTQMKIDTYINVYLAEHEGEVIGYASLSKYFGDGNALYLHVLNVRPSWHGKKVGKLLVLQCVKRAIELGYPRLDIHTWPGNTKAVPLYKKCGYMWEDRVDSTHLVNFVPTVLAADACKDFFKTADWYEDSARVIEVKPDGVKENLFEVFRYDWEKDGHMLAAGFERTGRRMRMIETDAYRVTLTAETHEPAFGFDYNCAFEAVNKNGEALNIKITGKDDKNIRSNFSFEENVTGTKVINARFTVGEISEPQDIWRVHPCVLADVWINGRHLEMGMGIETKWPVNLELTELKKVAAPGSSFDAFFNLTNNLNEEASVKISLPETASVTRFAPGSWELKIPALGKMSLKVPATAIGYGYEAVDAAYEVSLPDGRGVKYRRVMEVNSQGFTGTRGFETESDYVIQGGLWSLGLAKNGSFYWGEHLLNRLRKPRFSVGQICAAGSPYTDEFSHKKPDSVKMYPSGEAMTLEASYMAKNPEGIAFTVVTSVTANGIITRRCRAANLSGEKMCVSLTYRADTSTGTRTLIPYDGGVQSILDGLSYGTESIDQQLVDENWLFDSYQPSTMGVCWAKEYKPGFQWGGLVFEHTDISLEPGEAFETKPLTLFVNVFQNANDLRDYALQAYTPEPLEVTPHIEWKINGGNPFADAEVWTSEFTHKRNALLNGEITISAGGKEFVEGKEFSGEKEFTDGKDLAEGKDLADKKLLTPPTEPVTIAKLHMKMDNFDRQWERVLFVPNAAKPVTVSEESGVFTVSNGEIAFKTDPKYSNACHSLVREGREWLMSNWPEHKPHSWMNPFIGGINGEMEEMSNAMTVRERIFAAKAESKDSFGNVWKGVSSTVKVEKYDRYKGMEFTHYYLTLPGLPMLCVFTEFTNRMGEYKKFNIVYDAFLGEKGCVKGITLSGTHGSGTEYRMRSGAEDWGRSVDRLASAAFDDASANEKLYAFRKDLYGKSVGFWSDQNIADIFVEDFPFEIADGEKKTAPPVFYFFTDKEIAKDMTGWLDKIKF